MGIVLAACWSPSAAAAHPLDEVVQLVHLVPGAATLAVELAVTPGPLVGPAFARTADTDGNSQLSPAETETLTGRLTASLGVRVDGAGSPLTVTGTAVPPYEVLAAGGTATVTATAPMPAGAGRFEVVQAFDPGQPTTVEFDVVLDREAGRGPEEITRSDDGRAVTVRLGRGGDAAPGSGTGRTMLDALRKPLSSPWALLLLIGACAVLGGLHALTPGHGKTMLAAYLVGTRGTPGQALALGGIITITHTGSVLLLGAAVLLAGHYVVPGVLTPALQAATGLIVLVLGLRLTRRRWSDRHQTHPAHAHSHHYHHHHGPDRGHLNGHVVQVLDTAPATARTRIRELAVMGAAGGMIPCPEALGVLILATGLNRTALGLGMIVAFSAGLAAVLVALGLALVTARDRVTVFRPSAGGTLLTRLPLLSATLVTALGVAMTVTGLLDLPPFR
ncbi:nickel/cobalt transporter [Actinoplanes subglobosus]|uniref:Nickel/cobalt transporter n=1 Tax=Actinoplanes subglobosus TaxID=1547892 RepID=A0ABV8J451_9ACTN